MLHSRDFNSCIFYLCFVPLEVAALIYIGVPVCAKENGSDKKFCIVLKRIGWNKIFLLRCWKKKRRRRREKTIAFLSFPFEIICYIHKSLVWVDWKRKKRRRKNRRDEKLRTKFELKFCCCEKLLYTIFVYIPMGCK